MVYYKIIPLFNRKTKEPDGFELKSIGFICDYSGEILDKDEVDGLDSFKIDYYNGVEEAWYYDEEREDFAKDIEGWDDYSSYSDLMNLPYHFAPGEDAKLVEEWHDFLCVEEHYLYGCASLEEALRRSRLRTFKRLVITEKKVKVEELGILK